VPRKDRPTEHVLRTLDAVGPRASLSPTEPAGLYGDAASSQQRSGSHQHHTTHSASPSGATAPREPSRLGRADPASPDARPSSAPLRRTQSHAARDSHAGAQGGGSHISRSRLPEGGGGDDGHYVTAGATPRRPLSARPHQSGSAGAQQQQRAVHVSIAPAGEHWSSYSKRNAGSTGALFGCAATAAGAAAAHTGGAAASAAAPAAREGEAGGEAGAPPPPRWVPPAKASLEASFLSRLTRAAIE
jgi:hypothetical protein